jgi:hypothetical protein
VAEACQLQWQLAKSAETIVEQILTHVVAFGEDENLHFGCGSNV